MEISLHGNDAGMGSICSNKARYKDKIITMNFDSLISDGHIPHAGGPSYKNKSAERVPHAGGSTYKSEAPAPSDTAAESKASAGTPPVVAADDDDDGDGDGDPDSDRAQFTPKVFSHTSRPQTAPVLQRRTTADRILRMPELKARIGLSRSTIYEAIKNKEFPSSVSLGPRAIGWLESDIDSWLDSRISSRSAL